MPGGEWASLELTEVLIKNVILGISTKQPKKRSNFLQIYFLTLLHNTNEIKAN